MQSFRDPRPHRQEFISELLALPIETSGPRVRKHYRQHYCLAQPHRTTLAAARHKVGRLKLRRTRNEDDWLSARRRAQRIVRGRSFRRKKIAF